MAASRCGSLLPPVFADVRSSGDVIAFAGQPEPYFLKLGKGDNQWTKIAAAPFKIRMPFYATITGVGVKQDGFYISDTAGFAVYKPADVREQRNNPPPKQMCFDLPIDLLKYVLVVVVVVCLQFYFRLSLLDTRRMLREVAGCAASYLSIPSHALSSC